MSETTNATPHCCHLECHEPAAWRIKDGTLPDQYTDACNLHVGELLQQGKLSTVWSLNGTMAASRDELGFSYEEFSLVWSALNRLPKSMVAHYEHGDIAITDLLEKVKAVGMQLPEKYGNCRCDSCTQRKSN